MMMNEDIRRLREVLYKMVEAKIEALTAADDQGQFDARMRYLKLSDLSRRLETKLSRPANETLV